MSVVYRFNADEESRLQIVNRKEKPVHEVPAFNMSDKRKDLSALLLQTNPSLSAREL